MNTAAPATNDATSDAAQPAPPAPAGRRTSRGSSVLGRISVAAGLVLVAACGGEDGGDEHVAWKDMSFEERNEFMTDVVLPRMIEVFAEYDAKYENMTCATCHGSDGAAHGYAMPTPQITPLPTTPDGFLEWVADPTHPEREAFGTFMYERVTPEMAALLEIPRFDPMTEAGEFSCHYCHTLE
ncbi:hypothetical protein WMF18_19060 [Sorangium sp. So ce315]|uniref:hypothetical protein n=1 Tax=Sorangium sp. So ce315 TaxID=3133299 RepID=UPI003F5F663E